MKSGHYSLSLLSLVFISCFSIVVAFAAEVFAQPVTGSGTTGKISKFTGQTTIGNSLITEANGRIGIGTSNPMEVLDVIGGAFFRGSSTRANFAVNQNGTGDVARFLRNGVDIMTIGADVRVFRNLNAPSLFVNGTSITQVLVAVDTTGPFGYDDQVPLQVSDNNPSSLFSFNWAAKISGSNGSNGLSVFVDDTALTPDGTAPTALQVSTTGGVQLLTVRNDGSVHVGGRTTLDDDVDILGDLVVSDAVRITNNTSITTGNLGVGLINATRRIAVANTGGIPGDDPIADAWTTYSSRRWKEHVVPITSALEKIEKLRGVYFDWKESKKHDVGMIAEEVGEVIPELVGFEPNRTDAVSIDYARLTAVLVEAIKEQQALINAQNDRIQSMEQRLATLEATRGEQSTAPSPGEPTGGH